MVTSMSVACGRNIASVATVVFAALVLSVAEARPPAAKGGGGIDLRVTVSVDPPDPGEGYDFCGDATVLAAFTGENARWCYEITNNTTTPLTRHDLTSPEFGAILTEFPFTLSPGASAFITRVEPVTTSRIETATWTAYNPGPTNLASDTDEASLSTSPGVELRVTVSLDPPVLPPFYDHCGTETVLVVPPDRDVRWCYTIENLSSIARTRHSLESDRLGVLLQDFPFTLDPDQSAFLTQVESIGTAGRLESATWTAFRPGPESVSSATGWAEVGVALVVFADGFETPEHRPGASAAQRLLHAGSRFFAPSVRPQFSKPSRNTLPPPAMVSMTSAPLSHSGIASQALTLTM
jgi:hypothetical protein